MQKGFIPILALLSSFFLLSIASLGTKVLFKPLVQINDSGGLCSYGMCSAKTTITPYGLITKNFDKFEFANPQLIQELKTNINNTDFEKIKSKPFTGVCPSAYDGSARTFKFFLQNGSEITISACEYQLNYSDPVFQSLSKITRMNMNTEFFFKY